jgi:hypothetical protein
LIFSLLTVGQRARFHLPWRLGARGSSSCSP